MPPLYLMTELTGSRSNDDRKVIFSGYEMDFRHFWIAVVAAIPGIILTAIFWIILDSYALLFLIAVEVFAFYLIERRVRDGMELRTWQAIRDKRRAAVGRFYVCGSPVSMLEKEILTFKSSTLPLAHADEEASLLNEVGSFDLDEHPNESIRLVEPRPALAH